MKRLKRILLGMEPNTATYTEMYTGKLVIPMPHNPLDTVIDSDPTYWSGAIGFKITSTHKLAQDRPTVTVIVPVDRLGISICTTATADYCLRAFAPYIDALNAELYNRSRPDSENGKYYLYRPSGEVLIRNTAYFADCPQRDYDYGNGNVVYLKNDGVERQHKLCLCLRLQVQLPKRRLRKAIQMLCRDLPDAVDEFVARFDAETLGHTAELSEKQAAIRVWLRESNYCAFIANGSILPRGKDGGPLKNAIPFRSVPSDEIEVCGIKGMGIRRGVTVITGGGYSGKSTLLDAISAGIYDHVAGDGRELVITDESAVTISAEDGRSVRHVNIAPFIRWIPSGDPRDFSTEHASGSTSQAANIMEAVDGGARLLLIDEDRSATNFMIRDRLMKELIEREPITPFTDRVGELARERGVSTILVIGGSGEYLAVADRIYRMDEFVLSDATAEALTLCNRHGLKAANPASAEWGMARTLLGKGFTSYPEGSGSERLEVSEMGFILMGDERIDIRSLHNVATPAQLTALGFLLRRLAIENADPIIDVREKADALYCRIDKEGLDCIYSSYFTTCERFMDLPRKAELLAVINRMRMITFASEEKG